MWLYQRPITPNWKFFLFGTRISMTSYACASVDSSRSSSHSVHVVVDRGIERTMWEELACQVGHRDQLLIVC